MWQDSRDAAVGWVDVTRVDYSGEDGVPYWVIRLAAKPPPPASRQPGQLIAYGLVLDTSGDGVADYVVGLDNDAPGQREFHVWLTDLATGETDKQIGPPYGEPVEFSHPDEWRPGDLYGPRTMVFTFLTGTDSAPEDLNPETLRFYAWAAASSDGEVFAQDYAPDAGWIEP